MEAIPWWTKQTTEFVESILKPDMNVWEWGCGGSSLWLAERVGFVCSMEHDASWRGQVVAEAIRRGWTRKKLKVCLRRLDSPEYVEMVMRAVICFDLFIVDGRNRLKCFDIAVQKARSGAVIMVDDSERERYAPMYSNKDVKILKEIEPDPNGKKATFFGRL